MTPDTSELWIVAWRIRGRDKQQTFEHKSDATQLVRDLLATDCDLVILSREQVSIAVKITTVKAPPA